MKTVADRWRLGLVRGADAGSKRTGFAALIRLGVVVVVLAAAGVAVWGVSKATAPKPSETTTEIPALEVAAAPVEPGTIVPVNTPVAGGQAPGTGNAGGQQQARPVADLLAEWAGKAAAVTGIPPRALQAYGAAELAMRAEAPNCKLSWATLAGIGRIESNHGQYAGAVLGLDGRPSKPVIGVPLDGSPGIRAIADTEGGRFDGDNQRDRAVGPMQFIPSTWVRYASDGNLDGLGDPQQIDDAALGAGRYLCVGGRDLGGAQGWWQGILSYNNSVEYGQKVFGLADGYAKAAQNVR